MRRILMSGHRAEVGGDWSDENGLKNDGLGHLNGPVACHGVGSVEAACPLKGDWIGRCVALVVSECWAFDPVPVICSSVVVAPCASVRHGCSDACRAPCPSLVEKVHPRVNL